MAKKAGAAGVKPGIVRTPDSGQVKSSLNNAVYDGASHSAMEGFGKAYIIPFALALKASNTMIGVISSLPDLVGATFQLFSVSYLEKIRSRKQIILLCAFLQAVLWLPLLFLPILFQQYGPALILLFIVLQGIFSFTISPLWNSWMGDLVPEDERGRYFGKRNTVTGIVVFISTLVAGWILHSFSQEKVYIGFGILFIIALVSRIVSVYFLSRMHDVEFRVDKKAYFSFGDFVKRMSFNNYGRFVLYLCLLNFVVFLAAPFFTVYMLRDLKLDYMTFTIITVASLISSFIGMYFWGKFNDEHGSKSLLFINGILIAFVPLLWILTTKVYWFFVIEAFSGFVWAGFNLGSANFIFDATTPQKRTRCIIYYHVLKGSFVFAGAILGGYFATHVDKWVFASPLLVLFLISGIARLLVSLSFLPLIKEMRLVEIPIGHSLLRSHITVKPKQGIIYETIGTIPTKKFPTMKLEKISKTRHQQPQQPEPKKPAKSTKVSEVRKPDKPVPSEKQKPAAKGLKVSDEDKEKTKKQLLDYLQKGMKK